MKFKELFEVLGFSGNYCLIANGDLYDEVDWKFLSKVVKEYANYTVNYILPGSCGNLIISISDI